MLFPERENGVSQWGQIVIFGQINGIFQDFPCLPPSPSLSFTAIIFLLASLNVPSCPFVNNFQILSTKWKDYFYSWSEPPPSTDWLFPSSHSLIHQISLGSCLRRVQIQWSWCVCSLKTYLALLGWGKKQNGWIFPANKPSHIYVKNEKSDNQICQQRITCVYKNPHFPATPLFSRLVFLIPATFYDTSARGWNLRGISIKFREESKMLRKNQEILLHPHLLGLPKCLEILLRSFEASFCFATA